MLAGIRDIVNDVRDGEYEQSAATAFPWSKDSDQVHENRKAGKSETKKMIRLLLKWKWDRQGFVAQLTLRNKLAAS